MPLLFAIFIDGIVQKVTDCNTGCFVSFMFVNIAIYADSFEVIKINITIKYKIHYSNVS